MSWELSWRLDWRDLRMERVRTAVAEVLQGWPGATLKVEQEDADTISCFVEVPAALVAALSEGVELNEDQEGGDEAAEAAEANEAAEAQEAPEELGRSSYTLELSFYDLDQDGRVLSLEGEWSDNTEAWDAACTLAEELAEALDAEPLDL